MGKVKEKTPKDGGFGARLTFAILLTMGAIVCLAMGIVFTPPKELVEAEEYGYEYFKEVYILIYSMYGLAAGFGFYALLGYLGAIIGVKHKWADVLLIIFAAPMCLSLLGLLAVIGGVVGVKDINNPQRIVDRRARQEKSAGFGWRLTFAVLWAAAAISFIITTVIFAISVTSEGASEDVAFMFVVFVSLSVACTVFAVLGFICAIAGKKHKWANVLSIILGAITAYSLIGIPAIAGGVMGLRPLRRAKAEEEELEMPLDEQSTLEKADGEIQEVAAATATVEEEEALPEYIQPKMGKKGKKAIMITLIVSYSLLLLMGILLAAVPAMGKIISGMGICEEISARAYGITIGVMWVALVPSFGYYFATVSPIELSKKVRIIISVVSALLSVVMVVIFFVIINAVKIENIASVKEFYEGSDTWFIPLSTVFAALGLMICHALTLFKINPAKIRNKKPEKCGDGFLNVLKHVFALFIYGIIGLVKFILTSKERQPDIFILISTILLTWLAHFVSFVFAIICIAVLIGVVMMYFVGVASLAYSPSSSSSEKVYTDEYGNTVNLTEQSYVTDDRYQKVYKDEYGNEYISDDGGKHVHRDGE